MGEHTAIEWADKTFNPWMGCTKVSPACANCYAERDMDKRFGRVAWGQNGTRVKTSEANWRQPLKWNREAERLGVRYRVFCASLADVFEDWLGPITHHRGGYLHRSTSSHCVLQELDESRAVRMDDLRLDLFRLIGQTPHLDWLLLTKRPENIRCMWPWGWGTAATWDEMPDKVPRFPDGDMVDKKPPHRHNVWLGTSVENQEQADRRIPELLNCRDLSPVLFLSMEPLLGLVHDHSDALFPGDPSMAHGWCWGDLNWIIAGGESGPNARPSHPVWFRSIRDQCQAAGVPFFFKQWGECAPISDLGDQAWKTNDFNRAIPKGCRGSGKDTVFRIGKKAAGRNLDGREWNELPQGVEVAKQCN